MAGSGADKRSIDEEVGAAATYRTGFRSFPKKQIISVSSRIRHSIRHAIWLYYSVQTLRGLGRSRFDHLKHIFMPGTAKVFQRNLAELKNDPRIKRLASHRGPPFVILRNLLPVPLHFPADDRKLLKANVEYSGATHTRDQRYVRRIDTVLAGVLQYLFNAEPTYQFQEDNEHQTFGADMVTRWDYQELCDNFLPDMPLRFHQRTVHRSLPTESAASRITRFIAFGVVRNASNVPVLALTVRDILDTLEAGSRDTTKEVANRRERVEQTLEILRGPNFMKSLPRRIRKSVASDEPGGEARRRILGELPAKTGEDVEPIMSFDAAHVWPHDQSNTDEVYHAIFDLRTAIEVASFDAEKIYKIDLKRHDILIVDNLRATLSRAERPPIRFDQAVSLFLPKRRWLRMMLGAAGGHH